MYFQRVLNIELASLSLRRAMVLAFPLAALELVILLHQVYNPALPCENLQSVHI